MSAPSSHDNHPPLPFDDDGRSRTPDTAQLASQTPSPPQTPGKDPNSTPTKASATSTAHAFDRPSKKTLRPVYTGLEGMEYNLKQVTVDEILSKYVPGPDIPKKHLKSLHYIDDGSSLKPEWRVNTQIVRLVSCRITAYSSCLHVRGAVSLGTVGDSSQGQALRQG